MMLYRLRQLHEDRLQLRSAAVDAQHVDVGVDQRAHQLRGAARAPACTRSRVEPSEPQRLDAAHAVEVGQRRARVLALSAEPSTSTSIAPELPFDSSASGALRDQPALVDDQHAIAGLADLRQDVARQEHGVLPLERVRMSLRISSGSAPGRDPRSARRESAAPDCAPAPAPCRHAAGSRATACPRPASWTSRSAVFSSTSRTRLCALVRAARRAAVPRTPDSHRRSSRCRAAACRGESRCACAPRAGRRRDRARRCVTSPAVGRSTQPSTRSVSSIFRRR